MDYVRLFLTPGKWRCSAEQHESYRWAAYLDDGGGLTQLKSYVE